MPSAKRAAVVVQGEAKLVPTRQEKREWRECEPASSCLGSEFQFLSLVRPSCIPAQSSVCFIIHSLSKILIEDQHPSSMDANQ